MLKNKSSKKFKTTLLKSILVCGIFISPFAFAKNPLVTQAKELQTGSEKVGIDHQKAIVLLQKAVDEGDAEAMYLLAEYSITSKYNYQPYNPKKYQKLMINAALKGNKEAFSQLIVDYGMDLSIYGNSYLSKPITELRAYALKQAKNDPEYYRLYAYSKIAEPNFSLLEPCTFYLKAFTAGDIESAAQLKVIPLPTTYNYLITFKILEENR